MRMTPEEEFRPNGTRNSLYRDEQGRKYCSGFGGHWADPLEFTMNQDPDRADGLQTTCRACNTKHKRAQRARKKAS